MDSEEGMTSMGIVYRLSMGRNIPGGGHLQRRVTDDQLDKFLQDTVSHHFDGFSVTYGEGYWRGQREDTVHIDIVVDQDTGEVKNAIRDIAAEYNARFSQESVLVLRQGVVKEFVELRAGERLAA
jgi:hypothetical protein